MSAYAHSGQGPGVLALVGGVAHHPLDLLAAAEVVTRAVASERAFRVVVEADGAQPPVGARNCYLDDGHVVVGECLHVGVGEHVLAHLLQLSFVAGSDRRSQQPCRGSDRDWAKTRS